VERATCVPHDDLALHVGPLRDDPCDVSAVVVERAHASILVPHGADEVGSAVSAARSIVNEGAQVVRRLAVRLEARARKCVPAIERRDKCSIVASLYAAAVYGPATASAVRMAIEVIEKAGVSQ
jgi:hypothetical protein